MNKESGSTNRITARILLTVVVIAGIVGMIWHQSSGDSDELIVHVGKSMRPAAEALAGEFEKRYEGIEVRLNFGGSSDLLAAIELGQIGDLYMPHDPYAEILDEKGLLDYYEVVGHLEPVIIVPNGNPLEIKTLNDLAARGLKLSARDARYSTSGAMLQKAFTELGLKEEFENNLEMHGACHNDVALAVVDGHVDAGVVWNYIAVLYKDRVDMVIPHDANFDSQRITLCMLTHVQNRDAAEKFIDLATSEFGQKVFEERGYSVR